MSGSRSPWMRPEIDLIQINVARVQGNKTIEIGPSDVGLQRHRVDSRYLCVFQFVAGLRRPSGAGSAERPVWLHADIGIGRAPYFPVASMAVTQMNVRS